jgi:hypothetical protein
MIIGTPKCSSFVTVLPWLKIIGISFLLPESKSLASGAPGQSYFTSLLFIPACSNPFFPWPALAAPIRYLSACLCLKT